MTPEEHPLMMGTTHAATGLAAGGLTLAGLSAAGAPVTPPEVVVGAVLCAGAALIPDLDHPSSTASRSQSTFTLAACQGVRALSAAVWRATKTDGDATGGDRDGKHRHLAHTVPAAFAVGALVGVACLWAWTAVPVLWFVFSLSVRGLVAWKRYRPWDWARTSAVALVLAWVAVSGGVSPLLLGSVVALGMVVHVLGDALTLAGVPLLWPLRVRGARWRMFGAPLRFRTGRESVPERDIRVASLVSLIPSVFMLAL